VKPAEAGGTERTIEREGRERWRRTRGRAPEPCLRAERRGRLYEVTASGGGRSATLRLSERFARALASESEGCAGCLDRFFDKLFDTLQEGNG
jgi:hypothetical protein